MMDNIYNTQLGNIGQRWSLFPFSIIMSVSCDKRICIVRLKVGVIWVVQVSGGFHV